MVEALENASRGDSPDPAAVKNAREGLARTVKFVVQRHAAVLDSLRWRQQVVMRTLLNGWCAWNEHEHDLQLMSAKSTERLQQTLDTVEVPADDLPDTDWERDIKS